MHIFSVDKGVLNASSAVGASEVGISKELLMFTSLLYSGRASRVRLCHAAALLPGCRGKVDGSQRAEIEALLAGGYLLIIVGEADPAC